MMQQDRDDSKYDIFVADSIYPDAASVFGWRPQPLEELKDECIVVLDTNVLLVPYTVSSKSLDQIDLTYRMLIEQERLIVPGQVAREFANLRANKLAELHKQLADKKSQQVNLQTGEYPLLEAVDEYQEARRLEAEMNSMVREYKKALGHLLDRVREWTWNDPVSLLYGKLFSEEVILDPEYDRLTLEQDLAWRQEHKIPPGYKDAGKDDKGVGDLLIWHTILGIGEDHKRSVVFVSGDEKADWWHRGSGALYPRYELIDEYRRRSAGHSFHILSFAGFLDLYGVGKDVVEEVRQEELALSSKPAYHQGNAVLLPTGPILVVRHDGKYGAIRALRQTPPDEGKSIRYMWWFQPDGSSSFTNSATQTGYNEVSEYHSGPTPILHIGSIELEWSGLDENSSYVYFGSSSSPSSEYELGLTSETDISKIDASRLEFWRPRS